MIQLDARVYGRGHVVALDIGLHRLLAHADTGEHGADLGEELVPGLKLVHEALQVVVVLQDVVALDQPLIVTSLLVILHGLVPLVPLRVVVADAVPGLLHVPVRAPATTLQQLKHLEPVTDLTPQLNGEVTPVNIQIQPLSLVILIEPRLSGLLSW